MKVDTAYTTETTFAQTPVGFDEESVGLMADILSGLYTNPNEAVIREYTANGLDAQDDAGVDSSKIPVEVTLPQPLEPHLVISDRGIGMTQHQAEELFASYVSSDKRDTNEAIGGFGIGSMSAFAIADLMMITTVRDAVKTDLTVIRTDKGPQITESTAARDNVRPNGTTVTIPVDPNQDWSGHASNALDFCGEKVSIDGEQGSDPRGESPGMITGLRGHGHLGRGDRLVMGGMNYRIPESVMEKVTEVIAPMYGTSYQAWVIEVPIGTVRVAYDRESIMDTTSNAQALVDYLDLHYVEPMREQFLADTEWGTVRRMLDASADFIPAESLRQVKAVDNAMSHALHDPVYTGFEVVDDSRVKITGRFGSLFSKVVRAGSVMFFPAENTRSPKVRRWLIDHEHVAGPALAVAVLEPEKLNEVAEAGFTFMDAEALKAYDPVLKSAAAPRARTTGYLVVDPDTGEESMCEPAEIAQQYEAMVFGRDYSRDHHHYVGKDEDVAMVHAAWPNERVAIVRTTANQQLGTAEKRIGLPVHDLHNGREHVLDQVWELVSEDEKLLLSAAAGENVYGAEFGELDINSVAFRRAVSHPQQIIEIAQLLGDCLTVDLTKAKDTMAEINDPRALDSLRERLTEAGLNRPRWVDASVRAHRGELAGLSPWGDQVGTILTAIRHGVYGESNLRAAIAGHLVLGAPADQDR